MTLLTILYFVAGYFAFVFVVSWLLRLSKKEDRAYRLAVIRNLISEPVSKENYTLISKLFRELDREGLTDWDLYREFRDKYRPIN